MRSSEAFRSAIVTGFAKSLLAELQEGRFRSGMRNVAGQAVLGGGRMQQLPFEISVVVAPRAEIPF
jgi:hypothetical protein